MKKLRIVMAQLDFLVGDIEGNAEKIIQNALIAKKDLNADLVVFPELALTGYPPEDLLFRQALYQRCGNALDKIINETKGIDLIIGYPVREDDKNYNAAALIKNGKLIGPYFKMCLPNYSVFDEVRYFKEGRDPLVIDYHGLSIGITICEDLWHKEPLLQSVSAGAEFIISINASPFDKQKHEARTKMLQDRAEECQTPILYVNCVGGQDELVFDGGSLVLTPDGIIHQLGPFYQESLIPVDVFYSEEKTNSHLKIEIADGQVLPLMNSIQRIYGALVFGVRDYIEKNHFPGAIIGLSGGIDSALTLAIAVDAIGSDRVEVLLMPSRFTTKMSVEDAMAQAETMNIRNHLISIEPIFCTFLDSLAPSFVGLPPDITEENLQARIRGTLLMALSNKKGNIVLSTGNKSELSVGYSTLYGDMVGGFCVLKDIPKTLVYALAKYRNCLEEVIPERVFTREPSAELAHNQRDQDSLPPYEVLDQILELYIEKDASIADIVAKGFSMEIVKKVVLMVDRNEYKRRQAPPGVRITKRAFGRDRRYPITAGYSNYLRFEKK